MVFRMLSIKTEVQEIRVDENQNVTYLIGGVWQTASLLHQQDIQNFYDILLRRQVNNILDFHTHYCKERPKDTEYQISYKDRGKLFYIYKVRFCAENPTLKYFKAKSTMSKSLLHI